MRRILKRWMLFSAMMLFVWPSVTYSQTEYYPVGTTWEEVQWPYGNGRKDSDGLMFYFHYRHTVVGDTVVDGRNYKRVEAVLLDGNRYSDETHYGYKDYSYAIREHNDSIYILNDGNTVDREAFVYNFDWTPGIHHDEWPEDDLPVQQTVLLDGQTYDYVCWGGDSINEIRGIGSLKWGLIVSPRVASFSAVLRVLTSFTRDGVLIYEHDAPAYPLNDGIISVDGYGSPYSCPSAFYDLQGRRLKGKPSHGIYIQDGRKHVVK